MAHFYKCAVLDDDKLVSDLTGCIDTTNTIAFIGTPRGALNKKLIRVSNRNNSTRLLLLPSAKILNYTGLHENFETKHTIKKFKKNKFKHRDWYYEPLHLDIHQRKWSRN